MKNSGFWSQRIIPIFFLVLIFVAVFLTNYIPGTWLSGWDNLMTELNPLMNLKRAFFGVWQEYQGLGLLAGMGHSSDLFRQFFLWVLSFVFPTNFLRYLFHFLMLFIGPLGIFFLIKNFILEKSDENLKSWGAFVGSLFYLFNLATLQAFYVPLEVCSVHFAFLPWLFFGVLNFLQNKDRKSLLRLVVINLLAVAQGVVITFFFVYFLALSVVLIVYFCQNRKTWKRILAIYLLTFCLNAFWLLPNLYFGAKNVGINLEAKINIMSTEDIFLKNKKYGNLENVLLLKGFWFSNLENNNWETGDLMMRPWVNHLEKQYILGIGYLMSFLSIFGIFAAIKSKNRKCLLFLPVFLLSFIFLANDTPMFSFLAKLLYKLPLFSQIFRFPFMKFSILAAFCLAIFYSVGFVFISSFLKKKKLSKLPVFLIFSFLPIIFLYPIFQGKLFFSKERVKIPNEYFQIFAFFKSQDKNTRVANFPQSDFWGWTNYKWGYYSGSGFLWYGIEQPILDRAFDPWSNYNENYYWEISSALYSKNKTLFEKVLEKYQVSWLLVDGNVIDPSSAKALFLDELEEMIEQDDRMTGNSEQSRGKFELMETFGKIKIYKVNLETEVEDFVYLAEDLPVINSYDWGNKDVGFEEFGDYEVGDDNYDTYYPFRSLFTGRKTDELDVEIKDFGDRFVFKKQLPEGLTGYKLIVPPYDGNELIEIDKNDLTKVKYIIPTVEIVDDTLQVIIPKVKGLFGAEIDPTKVDLETNNCNLLSKGEVKNEITDVLTLTAKDANNCSAVFWLPDLSHKYGYLISAETKNISGKSLLFWLENLTNRKADMELYLDSARRPLAGTNYLIQPPMAQDGLGYTLHFDNISIGNEQTINELGKISVNPIPYDFLMGLKLTGESGGVNVLNLQGVIASHLRVKHPNPAAYEVKVKEPIAENTTLVLSQAFHEGWKAYEVSSIKYSVFREFFAPILGKEIKEHVVVNNWGNGWMLQDNRMTGISEQSRTIVLVFWPQYLEYAGFGLMGIAIVISLYRYIVNKKTS